MELGSEAALPCLQRRRDLASGEALFGYCDDYPTDPETRDRGLVFDPGSNAWSEVTPAPITAKADASLAKVFVNGKPRLSLVEGDRPENHVQFVP